MRKAFMYMTLAAAFAACSEDEDPKNITVVAELAPVKVLFGTAFSAIDLPANVTVTYSDNSTEEIPVLFTSGNYNGHEAGSYVLEAVINPVQGTMNSEGLKASITVKVATLKLRTVNEDGELRYEYFYDDDERLDHFTVNNGTEYEYIYGPGNRVTQRTRKLGGELYPEKYFYHADGKLDRIEFYYDNNILGQTHTYTYSGTRISRYDNSDQSAAGLKFRTFDYSGSDVTKISFDIGNSWNFTYLTDKKVFTPLILDPADPQNQVTHPVATFTYVDQNTYTTSYEFNAQGYPTKETRTYPGDDNRQMIITSTYE